MNLAAPQPLDAALHALAHVLAYLRALFGGYFDKLRAARRARRLPTDWRRHHEGLAASEWDVAHITAAGVAMLLEHGQLNVWSIPDAPPPPGWTTPMPRSADAMARRMEIIVRAMADIERLIYRRAERIALAALRQLTPGLDAPAPQTAPAAPQPPGVSAPPPASARAPP